MVLIDLEMSSDELPKKMKPCLKPKQRAALRFFLLIVQ